MDFQILTWMLNNLPELGLFLVAMFGWVVTIRLWKEDRDYHRQQYKVIGDRHDAERKEFIKAINSMREAVETLNKLTIEIRAGLK